MILRIYDDPETLSSAAAELFAQRAQETIEQHANFRVVLAGGSTPLATYQKLARPPLRDQIPWKNIYVFWGDERCVPLDEERSNYYQTNKTLLSKVPIPVQQIYPIRCSHDPEEASRQYLATLRSFFDESPPRFDLVLLGMGSDAHTASIFPGFPLDRSKIWVEAAYGGEPELWRITLTPEIINRAHLVLFLVQGKSKARALEQVLHGPNNPLMLPAQRIRPVSGELIWMVDRNAASELKEEK